MNGRAVNTFLALLASLWLTGNLVCEAKYSARTNARVVAGKTAGTGALAGAARPGARMVPGAGYYPTAVNVNLPDPQTVGKERRASMGERNTQFRESMNSAQLSRQKMQNDRLGKLTNRNAYHGISTSSASPGFASGPAGLSSKLNSLGRGTATFKSGAFQKLGN